MKITCYILALATILLPECLLAAERSSISSKLESAMRRRNEVEEHWAAQYRYEPSDSGRESRESNRWRSSYDEREEMGVRQKGTRARRMRTTPESPSGSVEASSSYR